MIIEVYPEILDKLNLNLSQLIFLSMVLDKNQHKNQDVHKLISLMSDDDISYLVSQGLITLIEKGNSITFVPTEKAENIVAPDKDYFALFYEMYPVYVLRPDGTKSYLRANVNKCRNLYNTYVGRSKAMAEHINDCLDKEVSKKMREGKISYMKTMWRWLVDHQWEEIEEELRDTESQSTQSYGTELI